MSSPEMAIQLSEAEQRCVEHCNEAAAICEWCADESAGEEGVSKCLRLCRDVADVASLHARFVARDSAYSDSLAELCADLCEACAEECARHDNEHCRACAAVLPACAESCRRMAA
jgi:hypothetical protein